MRVRVSWLSLLFTSPEVFRTSSMLQVLSHGQGMMKYEFSNINNDNNNDNKINNNNRLFLLIITLS